MSIFSNPFKPLQFFVFRRVRLPCITSCASFEPITLRLDRPNDREVCALERAPSTLIRSIPTNVSSQYAQVLSSSASCVLQRALERTLTTDRFTGQHIPSSPGSGVRLCSVLQGHLRNVLQQQHVGVTELARCS